MTDFIATVSPIYRINCTKNVNLIEHEFEPQMME